ncbi:MAG: hypothetical protein JWP04_876 [Belnapia sp.]|nr:hypothetical protein [Belnapia sp.]
MPHGSGRWPGACWAGLLGGTVAWPSCWGGGVDSADAALLLAALAMPGLRALGLLVAGALRPDHPLIAWATAVSQATLSASVIMAVVVPGGVVAGLPLEAAGVTGRRAAGLYDAGRAAVPALGVGLTALLAVRALSLA